MRRMFSILAVAALMAVAVGAAATLAVEGGAIQSGEDLSLTCDDAVAVDWGVESDDVASGQVFFVRVTGISEACFGNELFVNVTDGAGDILTGGAGEPIAIDETDEKVNLATPQDVSLIEDVHVIIGGPNGTPPAP